MSANRSRSRRGGILILSAVAIVCAVQRLHGQQATHPDPSTVEEFGETAVQTHLDDIKDFDVAMFDRPQLHGSRLRNNTPAGSNIPTTWNVGKSDRRTGQ